MRQVKPLIRSKRLVSSFVCTNLLFYLFWKENTGNLLPFSHAPTAFPLSILPTLAGLQCTIRMSAARTKLSLNITSGFMGCAPFHIGRKHGKTRLFILPYSPPRDSVAGLAGMNKLAFSSSFHYEPSGLLQASSSICTGSGQECGWSLTCLIKTCLEFFISSFTSDALKKALHEWGSFLQVIYALLKCFFVEIIEHCGRRKKNYSLDLTIKTTDNRHCLKLPMHIWWLTQIITRYSSRAGTHSLPLNSSARNYLEQKWVTCVP